MAGLRETITVDTGNASGQLKELGEGFGRTASSAGKLGGVLQLLGPAFAGAGGTVQIFADAAEVATIAGGALGVSLGTLAAVALPIAAVVGGLALAWRAHTQEMEESKAAAEEAAAALEAYREVVRGLDADLGKSAISLAEARGEIDGTEAAVLKAQSAIRDKYSAALDEAAAKTASYQAEVEKARAALDEASAAGQRAALEALKSGEVQLRGAQVAEEAIRARVDALQDEAQQTVETTAATKAAEQAERKAAQATRDAARAQSEATRALEARVKEQEKLGEQLFAVLDMERELLLLQAESAVGPGRRDLRTEAAAAVQDLEARAASLSVAFAAARDPLVDIAALLLDVQAAAEDGLLSVEQVERYTAALEEAQAQLERVAATSGKVSTGSAMSGLNTAGSALGSLSGGNPLSALSMAGPQAAAIAAALQGLGALGAKGAEGVGDDLRAALDSITEGLRQLPELLGDVLPDAISDGLPALVQALIEAAPELALASLKAQAALLKTLVVELPEAVGQGIAEALASLWAEIKAFLQNPGKGLFGGNNDNTFWQRAQNTSVDLVRVAAAAFTLGGSEILYGVANGATGGGARNALYSGSRGESRSRSSRARSAATPTWQQQAAAMNLGMQALLNRSDRRENLYDPSSAVLYGTAGVTQ